MIGKLALAMFFCAGCVEASPAPEIDVLWSTPESPELRESSPHETASSPFLETWADETTVGQAVALTCSTRIVLGLARQLVDELNCLAPETLVSIEDIDGVAYGPAVLPFMQRGPARALRKIMRASRTRLTINSALRALPQQYMLYRWYQNNRCGIAVAAQPDRSNHQSGLAVDIQEYEVLRSSFQAQGFRWLGDFDRVHFDYTVSGDDLRALSVRAFQRLWNRAHPEDVIAEDGAYGPATERRLAASPVNGFASGATCAPSP